MACCSCTSAHGATSRHGCSPRWARAPAPTRSATCGRGPASPASSASLERDGSLPRTIVYNVEPGRRHPVRDDRRRVLPRGRRSARAVGAAVVVQRPRGGHAPPARRPREDRAARRVHGHGHRFALAALDDAPRALPARALRHARPRRRGGADPRRPGAPGRRSCAGSASRTPCAGSACERRPRRRHGRRRLAARRRSRGRSRSSSGCRSSRRTLCTPRRTSRRWRAASPLTDETAGRGSPRCGWRCATSPSSSSPAPCFAAPTATRCVPPATCASSTSQISAEDASKRMAARKHHFMQPGMLESQFATLEPPGPDETDVAPLDAARACPSSSARPNGRWRGSRSGLRWCRSSPPARRSGLSRTPELEDHVRRLAEDELLAPGAQCILLVPARPHPAPLPLGGDRGLSLRDA